MNCLDQRLILSSMPLIASGGMEEDVAEFSFCPLWDGFAKTAIFYRDETEKYYAIVDSENKCVIPWEVLQSDGKLYFGVYGVKGGVRRTSEILVYNIKRGAFDEKLKPSEPTPDIYSQYVNMIVAVGDRVTPIEEFTLKPVPYELTGNPIQIQNYEGMPFSAMETQFSPKQTGSGDPSPTNIRPISGYESLSLTRFCGKNLFDKSTIMNNRWWSISSSTNTPIQSDREVFASALIPVKSGETYTLTIYTTSSGVAVVKFWSDMDNTGRLQGLRSQDYVAIDGSKQILTFKVIDGAKYVSITGDTPYADKIMLERGSIATDYEPYRGNTYCVDFDRTVYGGRMNWVTGELTVKWACVDATTLSWNLSTGDAGSFAQTGSLNRPIGSSIACSHYRYIGVVGNSAAGGYDKTISTYASLPNVRIVDKDFSSKDEYLAFFAAQSAAGTPVQIAYELAEPEIIQLTPQQIAALDGTNTLYGDGEIKVAGRKDILWLTGSLIERIETLEKTVVSLGGNV